MAASHRSLHRLFIQKIRDHVQRFRGFVPRRHVASVAYVWGPKPGGLGPCTLETTVTRPLRAKLRGCVETMCNGLRHKMKAFDSLYTTGFTGPRQMNRSAVEGRNLPSSWEEYKEVKKEAGALCYKCWANVCQTKGYRV